MNNAQDDQSARCWDCGYLLRGVESAQCPECGRPFNRADRTTMNFGRSIGRFGRWMIGPMGWWPLALSFIGAALVLCTTRWPVKGWRFSLIDLKFYANVLLWRDRKPGMSAIDGAYTAGIYLSAAALVWTLFRGALRAAGILIFRPPRKQHGRFWRRALLLLLLAATTIAGIGVGWPYRLGQLWAREWEATTQPITANFAPPLIESVDVVVPFRAAVLQGTARERRSGMKMLAEAWIDVYCGTLLREIVDSEKNLDNKLLALHLSGESGDPEFETLLAAQLDDPLPAIRTAGADGLELLWRRATGARDILSGEVNVSDPPIEFMGSSWNYPPAQAPAVRHRLQLMMLNAADSDERNAAAGALIEAPAPGYKLRYAEWGVLIGDGPGKVRFTNALKDDVPPFVHAIGNPAPEFESRIVQRNPGGMGKPVIHLTVDQPMAVRLEIRMTDGRPWFAYPLFDDLVLMEGAFGESRQGKEHGYDEFTGPIPSIRMLDPKGLPPLKNLGEGYAWASPQHREYGWYDPTGNWPFVGHGFSDKLAAVRGMGLLWRRMIVTPVPLASAHLADVPADSKYDWWRRLRQTPCSWISSRGETERFLYYDGPTIMPSPVIMKLKGEELSWTTADYSPPGLIDRPGFPKDGFRRSALYVEVHGGKVRCFWIDSDALTVENVQKVSKFLQDKGTSAESEFTARLIQHGLNQAEATAMADCWKKTFFKTDGRRALVILSQADYEAFCPVTVTPWPTEITRVGVVWTEFGN